MGGQIIQLRPFGDGADLESKLIGAVLELDDKHGLIEACGLHRDDFTNHRAAMAWVVCEVLARRRKEITADTVCSRGTLANMLSSADLGWLSDLEHSNMLTREQAIQIADDIRRQARGRNVRRQLQQEIDYIDRGRFNPGRSVDALNNIVRGLATDFAADETADIDLLELNQQWDENVKTGQTMLVPTGIRVLDQALGGGTPRNFWVLQGKPGSGKNMILTSMARAKLLVDHGTTRRTKLGLIGLENGTAWLTRRWQAEDLGLPQKEIGSKVLAPEEIERKARVDQSHFELLRRIHIYRHDGANIGELVRRILGWIFEEDVTEVLIDNLREVKQEREYIAHVAHVVGALRDVAGKYGIPIGLAVHDMEDAVKGKEGPPNPDKMQGGKGPGALSRCTVGVWRKGFSYRATVTKHEMGEGRWPNGPTCEFKANYEAGTMHAEAGRMLDLEDEEAADRRKLKERADEESVEAQDRRAAIRAARKTAAPDEPKKAEEAPAQPPLLEVPASTKPEVT